MAKKPMTDREVFQATVAHRPPSRILYAASFTPDLAQRVQEHLGGKNPWDHYGFFRTAWLGPAKPAHWAEPDYSRYWEGYEQPPGSFINGDGVLEVPAHFHHFTGYISPLRNAKNLAELENYPLPGDRRTWDYSGIPAAVNKAKEEGRLPEAWVGHMYETAWQIRDYEEFLMDMIERPAWAECLLERLFQRNLATAIALAKAGVERLLCGDDVASQTSLIFSRDVWKRMMLSRWGQVWRAVKEINPKIAIWYHSDGNIEPIVGDLIEAGVDILNPVQPECLDTDELHRRYGQRVCFDGLMGTQSTMPWGTPAEVKARVKEIIDKYGRNGGLIISPTHVLEPEVPIANIEAMVEACREYGNWE